MCTIVLWVLNISIEYVEINAAFLQSVNAITQMKRKMKCGEKLLQQRNTKYQQQVAQTTELRLNWLIWIRNLSYCQLIMHVYTGLNGHQLRMAIEWEKRIRKTKNDFVRNNKKNEGHTLVKSYTVSVVLFRVANDLKLSHSDTTKHYIIRIAITISALAFAIIITIATYNRKWRQNNFIFQNQILSELSSKNTFRTPHIDGNIDLNE